MDTREKIVNVDAARALLAQGGWIAVTGLFDPLTAVQAKRISGFRRPGCKLMAIIERAKNPLLEADARAALIAALKDVDAVTITDSARAVVSPTEQIELIEDIHGESARSADFVRYVLERQRVARNV